MYNQKVSITLPFALADIAAKVGKALDPDVGGEKSFTRLITGYDGETPIYGDTINATTLCTTEFKQQADYMMTNPQALFDVCAADYANRWADLTPPTLAECTQFCNGIINKG